MRPNVTLSYILRPPPPPVLPVTSLRSVACRSSPPPPTTRRTARSRRAARVRPIVRWGAEVMHRTNAPVTSYDDDLRELVADMVATMYAADGVGLAACQIGVDLAMFVFDCHDAVGRADRRRRLQPGRHPARGPRPASSTRTTRAACHCRVRTCRWPAPTSRRWRGSGWTADRCAFSGDGLLARGPPARDRPHPRDRLRRPALDPLAQEAPEGPRQDRRHLPRGLARRPQARVVRLTPGSSPASGGRPGRRVSGGR